MSIFFGDKFYFCPIWEGFFFYDGEAPLIVREYLDLSALVVFIGEWKGVISPAEGSVRNVWGEGFVWDFSLFPKGIALPQGARS